MVMIQAATYLTLYQNAQLCQMKVPEIEARVKRIFGRQLTYERVSAASEIPWYAIACIHSLESSLNFTRHLHNGDPLTARTVHVPRGRPFADPWSGLPYSWEQSAEDALDGRWRPKAWDLAGVLEFLERYNGLGYRAHNVNSPYLWSCTDQYTTGLFVFDGKFSPTIASQDIGAVALLKQLEASGVIIIH